MINHNGHNIERQINNLLHGVVCLESSHYDILHGDYVYEVKSCKEIIETGEKRQRGKILINVNTHRQTLMTHGEKYKYIIVITLDGVKIVRAFVVSGQSMDVLIESKRHRMHRGMLVTEIYHSDIPVTWVEQVVI